MIAAGQFAAWNAPSPALLIRWLALSIIIAAACWMSHGLPRTRLQQGERLLAVAESSHGVVAVVERGDTRRIKLNNYYVLGGTASTGDERMQAHIPLLLHPKPRRVAFLGLGTGITAGASLLHPVEHVTALEIVPEVIAAARHYFRNANLGIDAARMRIVPEDARNFLRASSETFDVIIGDLFVPWRRAEASLYTREHFVAARLSLTDGGLFCQWLPMFQLSETEFNMIAATFLDVFPSCTLWRGDFSPTQPALALVGHTSQGPLDPEMIVRRIRELQPDAANPFLAHPSGFWLFSVGPLDKDAVRFTNSRRHLDGKPWLELLGPLAHAGSKTAGELFVAGRLAAFLSEVRTTSQALTKLGPSELQWRQNGFRLAEATQLIQEGKHRAAEEIFADLRRNLPPEVRSLFGDP